MSFLTRIPRAAPAFKRAYATVADASGVKVAGVESGAPAATSSVTVVVKAGSRYETKPGAAHVLKSFAFKVRCLRDSWRISNLNQRREQTLID
jgi:ubiquinol-cytochrome c reductase core subunit 2